MRRIFDNARCKRVLRWIRRWKPDAPAWYANVPARLPTMRVSVRRCALPVTADTTCPAPQSWVRGAGDAPVAHRRDAGPVLGQRAASLDSGGRCDRWLAVGRGMRWQALGGDGVVRTTGRRAGTGPGEERAW